MHQIVEGLRVSYPPKSLKFRILLIFETQNDIYNILYNIFGFFELILKMRKGLRK